MATILASTPRLVEATSMIPTWQQAVKRAIRDSPTLLKALGLPPATDEHAAKIKRAEEQFPLFVPWEFVARMEPERARDPLLLQVLASAAEAETTGEYGFDPVGDHAAEILPGLLQSTL